MQAVNRLENEGEFKFTQLPNSWEEKGIRKGRVQWIELGIGQGIDVGKQEVALEMLKEG